MQEYIVNYVRMAMKLMLKEIALSSNSQLLILGNGFDLQCGLKSSFNDFMKTRLEKVQ